MSFDTATPEGVEKIRMELHVLDNLKTDCDNIYTLLMKKSQEIESKKTKFQGAFISQEQLVNGQYKFILKKLTTGQTREFISDGRLINEEEIKKFIPGVENIIVEYEILSDTITNKSFYKAKTVTTMGIVVSKKQ